MVYIPNSGDYRDTIGFNNLLEGQESKKLSIFDVPKGYVSLTRKTRRQTRKPSRRSSFRKEMVKYVNRSSHSRKSRRKIKKEIM
jgi:hypothetical protein